MAIASSSALYDFCLSQMAAESYLEDDFWLREDSDIHSALILGTNREGYNYKDNAEIGSEGLNQGWPGFTRMTDPQAAEFLQRFEVVHQWSDNPSTGANPGSRPAEDDAHLIGAILNSEQMLANTGLSATLIKSRETGEYTLSIRSTESRPWEFGGDRERDMIGTDVCGVVGMGFALAQLDALEKYYAWLKENAFLPQGATLNVTGYSLGGHLATVFTEIHQEDPWLGKFGETVTFNGAGRGNWNQATGSEADFLAYYRQVLDDPSSAAISLGDCSAGAIARAVGWLGLAGFAEVSTAWVRTLVESTQLLTNLEDQAVALAGTAFDPKSLYQDVRYGWAAVATMLKYDLSPQTPIGEGMTLADSQITQVYGYELINNVNMTANSQNNGAEQPVAVESQPLFDQLGGFLGDKGDYGFAHSIVLVSDSLALQRVMNQLDPSFGLDAFTRLMPALSRRTTKLGLDADYEADPLENALDALRRQILGAGAAATPFVNGPGGFGDWEARNQFHLNLQELAASAAFQQLSGIVSLCTADGGMESLARQDFGACLGLLTLSPIYLRATPGNEVLAEQLLSQAWSDAYTAWSGDRTASSPAAFSDAWLHDRADMLGWLQQLNIGNAAAPELRDPLGASGVHYRDIGSGKEVTVLAALQDGVSDQVLFGDDTATGAVSGGAGNDRLYGGSGGSDLRGEAGDDLLEGRWGDDVLAGGEGRDVLHGMAGSDHLTGGGGADHLEGGEGDDSYFFRSGDGVDTIFDSDGKGHLYLDGVLLEGGEQVAPDSWLSADGRFRFVLGAGRDGVPQLQVFPVGGNRTSDVTLLLIDRFANGDLGLQLTGAPVPDGIAAPIMGDVAPDWVTLYDPDGRAYQSLTYDTLGNIAGTPGAEFRADMLLGSGQGEVMHGGMGNDTLVGRDGRDDLFGDDGADLLAGGADRDRLEGGEGNDLLFGDANPWAGRAQAGLQPVPASVTPPVASAVYVDSGIGWARFDAPAGAMPVSNANPDAITPVLLQLSAERFGRMPMLALPGGFFALQGAADVLSGGNGEDSVYGEAGNDELRGGDGNDRLSGGSGDDWIEGDAGDDLLLGDDVVYAAFRWSQLDFAGPYRGTPDEESYEQVFGSDLLRGGDGDDFLFGMAGADTLFGGAGNDYLVGDFFEVVAIPVLRLDDTGTTFILDDSAHFAEAVAFHGNDVLDGGEGDDYLVGLAGDDQLSGGAGADVLVADGNPDEVQGRYGDDLLDGGEGADLLFGSGGSDHLIGGEGNDVLWGDEYAGTDGQVVASWGGAPMGSNAGSGQLAQDRHGSDFLEGGDGNDTLVGGGRDDRLEGGRGNDLLFGDGLGVALEGDDRLSGGEGDDELQGNGGDDVLMGEDGNDRLLGQDGDDRLAGGAGDDGLDGGAGHDLLLGGDGDDTLFGNDGEDTLEGGAGSDRLTGDAGDDTLTGGAGVDFLGGGEGDDVFVLAPGDSDAGGDVLEVIDAGSGHNTLRLEQISLSALSLHLVEGTDDLVLDYSAADSVYLRHGWQGALATYQLADGEFSWDEVVAARLLDPVVMAAPQAASFVVGGRAADSLVLGPDTVGRAGPGDDQVLLTGPGDVLLYNAGDGLDSIRQSSSNGLPAGAADVRFGAGISVDTLRLVLAGAVGWSTLATLDIVVGNSPEDALRVSVDTSDMQANPVLGTFAFADGSSLSFADLLARKAVEVDGTPMRDIFSGTNANDYLSGGDGDDMLYGLAGADCLDGGLGNDLLYGGEGGDTYVYRTGEGNDWLRENDGGLAGDDILLLSPAITPDNLMLGQNGHNLTLRVRDLASSLVIEGQVDCPEMRIEYFQFADGTRWSASDALGHAISGPLPVFLQGTDAAETLEGGDAGDQLLGMGGDDALYGNGGDDRLFGGEGGDYLYGYDGSDSLEGGAGGDQLFGGAGNDGLAGGDGSDVLEGEDGDDVLSGGAGNDTLKGGAGIDLLQGQDGNDQLYGGEAADNLAGGEGDDSLSGDAGNDTLYGEAGDDHLAGGAGDDRLLGGEGLDEAYGEDGTDTLDGGAGADRLFGGAGNDLLQAGDGDDFLMGEAGDDSLWGDRGDDYALYGGIGNDDVHGGDGQDTLFGEEGNDLLFGDAGSDRLWDGAGDDELHGGDGDDDLTAGVGSNRLFGDAGDDMLRLELSSADAGLDTLAGGTGDDTYVLQSDIAGLPLLLVENPGEGTDTVLSFGTITLADNIENLTLAGFSGMLNFNGSGNALDNVLRGNAGSNQLAGAAGNDTYYVGLGDSVIERAGEGVDIVYADCDWVLSAEVENLVLLGAARNGSGNAGSNLLTGNAQDNVLDGGAGMDRFEGGLGNDLYLLDLPGEVVIERSGEGIDTIQCAFTLAALADNVENIVLTGKKAINATGNSLDNLITGNAGVNVLAGGLGNDTYVVGARDLVSEVAGEGIDTIQSAQSWVLDANVENLVLTGSSKIAGTGNDLDNRLVGNSAANVLKGGKGNDIYVVGAGDSVTELAGEGNDTIESAISWTLSANLENLTLTGTAAVDATGNGLANRLRGNAAANTLRGGAGNDLYCFGRGGGIDTIVDVDSTAGNVDRLLLDMGIDYDQLWFGKEASNLVVSVIGGNDRVVISDWYASGSNHVERIEVADGHWLADSRVDALVQAMAQMQPPTAGQLELTAGQWQQLEPVLAASWQVA